jgi:hypothetical protein
MNTESKQLCRRRDNEPLRDVGSNFYATRYVCRNSGYTVSENCPLLYSSLRVSLLSRCSDRVVACSLRVRQEWNDS